MASSVFGSVTILCLLPTSLTCAALQWDAVTVFEKVSWAAVEAAVSCHTSEALCRTGFTTLPFRVEEALWTDFSTLTLEKEPGHTKSIWMKPKKKKETRGLEVIKKER